VKQIGRRLGISPHTVAALLGAAKVRLGIYDRPGLVVFAMRQGWVRLEERAPRRNRLGDPG
jgi:DNA-binding CsgD family transcriptional regulator